MEKILFGIALIALTATACNNGNTEATTTAKNDSATATATTAPEKSSADTGANTATSMHEMVTQYLQIKNALADDHGKDAANAGNAFVASMAQMEKANLAPDKKKIWKDIADDAKEMATHIGKSADRIEHQREHFDMLSKDMYDLVKAFGAGQPLYNDFCPMYNHNKGASWLSESKEIKNPYMGKKQPACGSVKEEIK